MNKQTADALIGRAGHLAILYYPEIGADDPGYSLAGDVDWVLQDAEHLPNRNALRALIAQVIIDPTGARDAFTSAVYATVTE